MTLRPRAVKALKDARTKLRDLAAATHANDAALRDRAEASGALAAASSVWDLDEVSEITGVHKLAIVDAQTEVTKAQAVSDASAERLRDSARKLKVAEELLDRCHTEQRHAVAKAEQRSHDDLAASVRK
jgi:flagellar export protein FliJ